MKRFIRQLWHSWLKREKNILSALICLIVFILLTGALCEEQWLFLQSGPCSYSHLGLAHFYGRGSFQYWYSSIPYRYSGNSFPDTNFFRSSHSNLGEKDNFGTSSVDNRFRRRIAYTTGHWVFVDCVTPKIVAIFHILIGVCFASLVCSFISFTIDFFGVPQKSFWPRLRRSSVFSLFSALTSCGAICLTSWLYILVHRFQRHNSDDPDSVQTSVEDGFYLIFVATILSICAVFINLIKSTWKFRNRRRFEDMRSLLSRSYSRTPFHQSGDNESTATNTGGNVDENSNPPALLATPILLPLQSSDAARRQLRKKESERLNDVLIPKLLDYLTPTEEPDPFQASSSKSINNN